MSIEIQSYFAEGERYPALIGVRAEGDEYETAYVSKSELVDALVENAKLREERNTYRDLVGCTVHPDIPDQLKADNAKLRELVRDMVLNMGGCALHGNPLRLREFMARARELGVEVIGSDE